MRTLAVQTKKKREVVDITEMVEEEIASPDPGRGRNDIHLVNLFVKHTTAALTVADLDPGTDLDMLDAFEQMVPKLNYRHPHDPSHVPDHILSAMIGVSLTLPVRDGKLNLGQWQRVVLMEFDGPRQREIVLT